MKITVTLFLLGILSFRGLAQEMKQELVLDTLHGWRTELMKFPLDFAPEINIQGIEDIRFAPGWSKKEAIDFWTYKFAWMLDSELPFDSKQLEGTLYLYFNGLAKAVAKGKSFDINKITPPRVQLQAQNGDINSFVGSIDFWDTFFTQATIHLNLKVKKLYCSQRKKYLMVFEFSPQPFEHQEWINMAKIGTIDECH